MTFIRLVVGWQKDTNHHGITWMVLIRGFHNITYPIYTIIHPLCIIPPNFSASFLDVPEIPEPWQYGFFLTDSAFKLYILTKVWGNWRTVRETYIKRRKITKTSGNSLRILDLEIHYLLYPSVFLMFSGNIYIIIYI